MANKTTLLLGTRKGLVVYEKEDNDWQHQQTHFLGIPVSIAYADERNGTWWACLDHGHWGCKLHRSTDRGKNWEEISAPTYPDGLTIKDDVPAATKYIWALQHGGHDKPNRLWLGTVPGGLFLSEDNGDSFQLIESLWNHPSRAAHWFGGGFDHPGVHSVVVDPQNSDHIFVGISVAGVFESMDAGKTWHARNKGLRADYLPDPNVAVGHDPHLLVTCPSQPAVMWQQNHCGIFVSQDAAKSWSDVTQKGGPANFGFTIAVAEDDPNKAWVIPGISDEIRTAVGNSLCVCRTDDGGKTWKDFRAGLPQESCYDIVYRHALDVDKNQLCFGTTCGNVFLSEDSGESWICLNHFLPMVYSVLFCE